MCEHALLPHVAFVRRCCLSIAGSSSKHWLELHVRSRSISRSRLCVFFCGEKKAFGRIKKITRDVGTTKTAHSVLFWCPVPTPRSRAAICG